VLQQAIGKAAGRGSHIERNPAADANVPVFKCTLELLSAAAYVFQVAAEQPDFSPDIYGRSWLLNFLLID
jgi:hypothetical protein